MSELQKKEKALRSKLMYYRGLQKKGTILIQQPSSYRTEEEDPSAGEKVLGFIGKNIFKRKERKSKKVSNHLVVADLVLELEHKVFKLQSKLIQQGLPILPLP